MGEFGETGRIKLSNRVRLNQHCKTELIMPVILQRALTENRQRILQQRHNLFMDEVGSRMVLSFLIAACLPALFFEENYQIKFAVWYAMLIVAAGLSFGLIGAYKANRQKESLKIHKWNKLNLFAAFIWAILWSSLPFIFLQNASQEALLTSLVILSLATSIPSVSMGVYPLIFISFILPVYFAWFLFTLIYAPEAPFIIKTIPLINLSSLVIFSIFVHRTQISNIALRIQAEQDRERAVRASESKTRFLATASHDLRQPLQAATLYTAILKNAANQNHDIIAKLDASISSCNELLGQLLTFSQLQSEKLKPQKRIIDLQKTIQPLIDDASHQAYIKGIKVKTENLKGHYIFTDDVMFCRIIRNLINNAVKYTKQGRINISVQQEGAQLFLKISDTGIGIDEAYHFEVFEEYIQIDNDRRSLQNGMGLGLAIVNRLSYLCDIPIEMFSRKGNGTTFTLKLQAATVQQPNISDETTTPNLTFESVTVLLIDDDKNITEALSGFLSDLGATVSAHQSLETAIRMLEEARTAPSIIITDDQIGENVSSSTVISALNKLFDHTIPTLIITGNTSTAFMNSLPKGIDVLFKPVKVETLTSKMKAMLTLDNAV